MTQEAISHLKLLEIIQKQEIITVVLTNTIDVINLTLKKKLTTTPEIKQFHIIENYSITENYSKAGNH